MNLYIGTKTIKAQPMTRLEYNLYRGWELPKDEDGSDKGYLVEYLDSGASNHPAHMGYISWSPKEVFDHAYNSIDGKLTFGDALVLLRDGERVTRSGWNGKDMWIALHRPDPVERMTLPYLYMKTVQGDLVPWLASQTDMLAEDWGLYLLP